MAYSTWRMASGAWSVARGAAERRIASSPALPAPAALPLCRPRGFTLIELLVSIVLVGIVSASIYGLLLNNQRVYRHQAERVELNGNIRSAVAILPTELFELNATDPIESDIVSMSDTAIAYKSMRNLYFLCQPPVDLGSTGTVILWAQPRYGLRPIDDTRDSVFIFAERDPSTTTDNYWLHANVTAAVATGTACPGGAASVTVALGNVTPAGGLADIAPGAPLRSFEVVEMLVYTDVMSDGWLGRRQYVKGSGWESIEPILGPMAPTGLRFVYYDAAGAVTANRAEVARVGMQVVGRTHEVVRTSSGTMDYVVDSLTTHAALRNNLR